VVHEQRQHDNGNCLCDRIDSNIRFTSSVGTSIGDLITEYEYGFEYQGLKYPAVNGSTHVSVPILQ
jgi:hypothetical protein